MVTEVQYKCTICGGKGWSPNVPSECPDCTNPELEQINTRERDEENGECSIGAPEDANSDVNCELIATHEADVESDYEDTGYYTRKICDKHKRLWEGSPNIIEIREL